ncbi:MAG TPA: hypothetical protein VKQ11_22190 [Candidatus Sulfotelmatobacter sp.]|nr:hypothetical protein [Candidatus Sulfotelmatobacter sp.]
MSFGLSLLLLVLALAPSAYSQEPSLGDVARSSRTHRSTSPPPAKVFSNEESGPSEIKDGEAPLDVFTRAALGLLHDASHRCQAESSGNSGPGWRKANTVEVVGSDRTHFVMQDGSDRWEWIVVGGDYYLKLSGSSWQKMSAAEATASGRNPVPGVLLPQEMEFRFEPGELKLVRNEVVAGVPVVFYRYTTHSSDFDRSVNYWIGKQDSLPRRIDMRTETRSWGIAPIVWQESISCTYGIEIKIEPPN